MINWAFQDILPKSRSQKQRSWHLCLETSLLLNRIRILTGEKAVIILALLLLTRAYLHSLLNFLTVSQSPACHTGHGPMLHCA